MLVMLVIRVAVKPIDEIIGLQIRARNIHTLLFTSNYFSKASMLSILNHFEGFIVLIKLAVLFYAPRL
jgi:hypothetical protein